MKTIGKAVCFTAAVFILMGCTGQYEQSGSSVNAESSVKAEEDEKILLADYFERVVGTETEEPYTEYVLYKTADGMILEYYKNGGTDDEKVYTYQVSGDPYAEILKVIDQYDMRGWDDLKDYESLDGMVYVCRFKYGSDRFRVSSEKMPDDGRKAFRDFGSVLWSLADEKNLVQEN